MTVTNKFLSVHDYQSYECQFPKIKFFCEVGTKIMQIPLCP